MSLETTELLDYKVVVFVSELNALRVEYLYR